MWPDAIANALAAIDGVSRRESLQQLRESTEMGELEDKDLGELTATGELEPPEGVEQSPKIAALCQRESLMSRPLTVTQES